MKKVDINTRNFCNTLWKGENTLREEYGNDNFMLLAPTVTKKIETENTFSSGFEKYYNYIREIDFALELHCFNLYNFFTEHHQLYGYSIETETMSFSFQRGLSFLELTEKREIDFINIQNLFDLYNKGNKYSNKKFEDYVGHRPFLTNVEDYTKFKEEIKHTEKLGLENIVSIFL